MAKDRRVLIMAGGTGGHVFPALAVANELRRRQVEVSWLGTRAGIEAQLVPAAGIPLFFIEVKGVRGKGWGARLAAPWRIARALWQSLWAIKKFAPEVVVGMGGFAAGPGGMAARLFGLPLVIHEQNAIAGTTNRILSKIATRVLLGFPGVLARGEHVGNPVRPEIALLASPDLRGVGRRDPLRLLVLGGSLGARAINQLVPQALGLLHGRASIEVRHQCGRGHQEETQAAYCEQGVNARVEPFIDDMAQAYEWADFVICRAGALTVSELAVAGVAALLIPFPAAIDDHQTHNARWLADAGGALLVQQRDLDAEKMAAVLRDLEEDRGRLLAMAGQARDLAKPDACQRVVNICLEMMS